MRTPMFSLVCVIGCVAGAGQSASAGNVVFTDGDFGVGWVDSVFILDDVSVPGEGPGTSTGSIDLLGVNGNPGFYRESIHNVEFGDVVATVGLNTLASYSAAEMDAIGSVSMSIDLLEDPSLSGSSGFFVVLEQDGIFYFGPIGEFLTGSWENLQFNGLTAQDFEAPLAVNPGIDEPGMSPDFSIDGSEIRFGYGLANALMQNQLMAAGLLTIVHGADNWEITVAPVGDADNDGVLDNADNCLEVANSDQRDSNNDGFGNVCDADLDNDCLINFSDLGMLRIAFFSDDEDSDFNGDGVVSAVDLGIMRSVFFGVPGPSGVPGDCSSPANSQDGTWQQGLWAIPN